MTEISDGTNTITPLLVNGYEATSESQNIIHRIVGRSNPDYSLGGEATRTGTLKLLMADESAAHAAHAILAADSVFTLTDPDTPGIEMTFVRKDSMRLRLAETQVEWILEVGFVEVVT